MPYIELDHRLKPRKLEEINDDTPLPDNKKDASNTEKERRGYKDTFLVKKYRIETKQVQSLIQEIEKHKLQTKKEQNESKINYFPEEEEEEFKEDEDKLKNEDELYRKFRMSLNKEQNEMKGNYFAEAEDFQDKDKWKNEDDIHLTNLEPVIGPDKEVNFDQDWGLFSAVLTCYNNHWVLKSGPDDWWTVVNRRIAAALDDHGDVEAVRKFFVDHEGKKKINLNVGPTLSNIDYSWLFTQFSSEIRQNIKAPGYVDLMQPDFSTTTPDQLIISQIMLMASVKKYFSFGFLTLCGIPGVEMKGTEQDWEMLIDKLNNLEIILHPVIDHLKLIPWFKSTKIILINLLNTYKGQPDKDWWGNILCWNQTHGSGAKSWFSGWFPEFLGCNNNPGGPNDFPSGLVSVPIHIQDQNNHPPVNDDGLLVAGTVGFTVSAKNNEIPVVEPHNTWSLLLPANSPVTHRLKPSK